MLASKNILRGNGENLGISKFEFKVRTETLGNELVGKGEDYRSAKYEIVSHERNILIVKIFSSLAGGVSYRGGSADIIDGFIHLFCTMETEGTIEFELLAWELTYTIEYDNDLSLDIIYFLDEKILNTYTKSVVVPHPAGETRPYPGDSLNDN